MALNVTTRINEKGTGYVSMNPVSQEGKANTNGIPVFKPDPDHCAVEHAPDETYDNHISKFNGLENFGDIRYSSVAKRAFLYSEILGRPLSQRRRT